MSATIVSGGGVRLRVRSWRGRGDVADLAAVPAGAVPSRGLVEAAVGRAVERGFTELVTPALARSEWRPYLDVGFELDEELHLLAHPMLDLPGRRPRGLRRALRRDRAAVLDVDNSAFPPFWQLDDAALDDALAATPSARFRVDRGPVPTGYAITGRSGDRGYVQRLAVHPDHQGRGLGAALVLDGLWWLRRWRVREVFVNTQHGNDRAVHLYERLGFRSRPDGLGVLRLDLRSRR